MIRSALQPNRLQLTVLLLAFVSALMPCARSQQSAAPGKPETVRFAEITSQLHISLPPISLPSGALRLPIPVRSQDYSLEYARRNLVPAMGGSIVVGDFDGDGHPDLYVIVPGGLNHLLRNRPDGTFADVTEQAGVPGTGADLGGAFGDFDKTGNPSLFVAGLGGVVLYHNNGDGTFTDITEKAGLKKKPGELATSVLLFDADNDGFLDLLVTVYTDLNVPPVKKSFTFPNDFAGASSHLYRNQHNGTFAEITEAADLTWNPGRTQKAVAADFNHNGNLDLLLLRDDKPPVLYRNQGRGKFDDETWDAGRDIWKYAYVDAQTGDFNRDGKMDVVLWSTIGNEVLVNLGNGKFKQDESLPLVYAANRAFGFHGMTADFNGDGYDDLLTVDNEGNWHFIVNHAGKFAEAPFTLSAEATPGSGSNTGAPAVPFLAFMTAARLRSSGTIDLLALTMDGRVEIFERQPVRGSGAALHPNGK
jgi:hypothetical protein